MAVLLVLVTFLIFIALDYLLNRRKAVHTVGGSAVAPGPERAADYVEGFLVPENVSYHSGHSWLVRERQNVVRVGADEFAAALLGKIEKIELAKTRAVDPPGPENRCPSTGTARKPKWYLPPKAKSWTSTSDLCKNPALLRKDPYGKGWLLSVHVPDEENTGRNLVPARLVREWMREAIERLYALSTGAGGRGSRRWRTSRGEICWRRCRA